MDQVYRIEIPVEAIDATDAAALRALEATLQRIFTTAKSGKGDISGAIQAANSAATAAIPSLKNVENATKTVSEGFSDAGSSAQDMGNDAKTAASNAEGAADKLEGSVDEVGDSFQETGNDAKQAGSKAESALQGAGAQADKFSQRMEKSQKTLRQMFKEKIKLIMEAVDRASPVLKNIWNSAKNLGSKAWSVAVRMKDMITAPFRKLKSMLMSPITIALSVAGVSLGAGDMVKTYTDFTTGMSTVKALTGATNEQFVMLTDTAKELGATTKFTAAQAAEGMKYLGMAGWDTNEIIEAMPGLLNLAAAGATDLGTAADIVSDVMTAMGMSADQASTAADIFARTATMTNTTISGMGESLKYAAPIAHSFGLSLSEVSTLVGMMGNAGIKASMAGTAIRSSLLNMATPSKEAAKLMGDLGLSFSKADGSMKDMGTIVGDLKTAFKDLTAEQRLSYAETIFGTMASSAWLGIIDQGADEYNRLFSAIDNSRGAAEEMSKTQMDNLAGDFTLLQSAVDGMKISLVDKLSPYLRKGVQWLTSKIPEITDKVGNFIDRAIQKAKDLKDFLGGVFNSSEFKNADGFAEKFFVAWDKIIAEPFKDWWNSSGKELVTGVMSNMGSQIGELLHGIILGIWAGIKGEEIDFDGLNIGGLAQAGAEAAKSFVSGFASSLNLGEVVSEAPGGLKALAGGLIGIKAIGGVMGAAKNLGMLRLALGGGTTAAAAAGTGAAAAGAGAATTAVGAGATAAAAGAGKATVALGGLKTALAAIPVWGWVAAAAITAVAIGAKAYADAQEKERQSILHIGDDAEKAATQYQRSARNVKEAADLFDGIHTIELQIKQGKNNTSEIAQTEANLNIIKDREVYIELVLSGTSLTEQQVKDLNKELSSIKDQKVDIEAKLASGTLTEEQIREYQEKLNSLTGREVEIEAILSGTTLTEEQIAAYQEELDQLHGQEVELTAKLAEDRARSSDVVAYMQELSGLKGRKEVIRMELDKGVSEEEAAEYMRELEIIEGREEIIHLKLDGLGVTQLGLMYAQKTLDEINGKEAQAAVILSRHGLTDAQIQQITGELKEVKTRKAVIRCILDGASLTEQQVADYRKELEGITTREAQIEAKMAEGGLTQDEIANLSAEYNSLQSREAFLNMSLAGSELSEEQIQALADEYGRIDAKEAAITAKLSEAGLSKSELEAVSSLYNGIASKTAELTVTFSANSLDGDDLKEAADNLDRMYQRLAEMSGGAFTAEDLKNGYVTEEGAKAIIQKRADTDLLMLETEVVKARNHVDDAVANRDAAKQLAANAAAAEQKNFDIATSVDAIEARRQQINSNRDYNRKNMTTREYADWLNSGEYDKAMSALKQEYTTLTGKKAPSDWDITRTNGKGFDSSSWWTQKENAKQSKEYMQGEYNTQNESLKKLYNSEKALIEGKTFNGTDLAGYSLEELAASYSSLDETGRQLFQDAVMALNTLNEQTDYVGQEDKADALGIVELAQKTEVMEGIKQQVGSIATDYAAMSAEQKETFKASEEGMKQLADVNTALENLGLDKIGSLDDLKTALDEISGLDFDSLSSLDLSAVQGAFAAVSGVASGMKTSLDAARAALQQLDGKSATTTVTNNVYNNTYNNTYTNSGGAAENAEGGIYNGAFLSWVAEDGPEAIIPLGSARRERGYELWLQAGKMLGVSEYAEGGILSPYSSALGSLPDEVWDDQPDGDEGPHQGGKGGPGGGGGNNFSINVSANPTFTIQGGNSPDDILAMLKSKQKELAELLGGAFADELEDIVSNMV